MKDILIPNKNNNYHPYLLRSGTLSLILVFILIGNVLFSATGLVNIEAIINVGSLYSLHNIERTKENLPELKINQLLINSANAKAKAMLDTNCWSHYCPDGKSPWEFFISAQYEYIYAGENLAEGFIDNESMMNAWIRSVTHKENILNKNFDEIGIGIAQGDYQNKKNNTIIVIHFGKSISGINQQSNLEPTTQQIENDTEPPEISLDDFTVNTIVEEGQDYYYILFKNSDISKLIMDDGIESQKLRDDTWQFRISVSNAKNLFALVLNAYDTKGNKTEFELPISIIQQKNSAPKNNQNTESNMINTAYNELTKNPKVQLNLTFAIFFMFLFGIDFYILDKTGRTSYEHNNRHLVLIILIVFLFLLTISGFGGQILDGLKY